MLDILPAELVVAIRREAARGAARRERLYAANNLVTGNNTPDDPLTSPLQLSGDEAFYIR